MTQPATHGFYCHISQVGNRELCSLLLHVLAIQRAGVLLGCSLLRFTGQMEQTSRSHVFCFVFEVLEF